MNGAAPARLAAAAPLHWGVALLVLGTVAVAAFDPAIGLAVALVPVGIGAVAWVLADPAARVLPLLLLSGFLGSWLPPLLTVGGLNLRVNQLTLAVVLAALLLRPDVMKRPPWARQYAWPMVFLWLTALVWTVLNSPDLPLALSHVVLLGINLAHLWLVVAFIGDDGERLRRCLLLVAWATIGALCWTVVVLLAAQAGLGAFRAMAFVDQLPMVGPSGVRLAPIIRFVWGVVLGSYFGSLALICGGLARSGVWGARLLFGAAALAGAIGIVLGLARGPLVAYFAGVLTYAIGLLLNGRLVSVVTAIAGGVALVLVAYLAVALVESPAFPVQDAFLGKVVQLGTPQQYSTGTAGGRMHVWLLMLEDIRANPFVGSGFDAYRAYVADAFQASENFPLEILHATGVLGFGAYAVLQLLAVWRAVRVVLAHRLETRISQVVLALLAAHTGLTLASATNPTAGAALYWLLFGLLIVAAEIGLREPAPARSVGPAGAGVPA